MSNPGHGWDSRPVIIGEVTIEAQALGDSTQPALLLIGGATWSRDWWPDALCEQMVAAGLRVLRYDTRDTGQSTSYTVGQPGYTAVDLSDDAVAVLDAFDVDKAVVLGMSMGGGTAQLLAARHRDRVAGLVLVSTSPADDTDRELPGPSPEIMATFEDELPEPAWSDRDAVVEWVLESERPYAGPGQFDESSMQELVTRVWDRTPTMAAAVTNHFMVAASAPPVDLDALRTVPALVVHGSADPLFLPEHGRALAAALDAPLLILDGVGHQAPPPHTWSTLIERITQLVIDDTH